METARLSIYRNSYDTAGVIVQFDAILQRILTGNKDLAEKTRYANALALTDPKGYKTYKEREFPAVTFGGTFPKGKRKAKHLSQHSGLVTIDIDGLPVNTIPDLLVELAQTPQVVLAFVSPSGLGIKAVVRVDPIPHNDMEHKGAYQACLDFFEPLSEEYGFTIDTSGKDCSRLCYLSHHSNAIVHTDPPTIDWDCEAWLTAEKEKQARFEADAKTPYTGEVDITALDHIDHHDLDYNQWLSVITACKAAGMTCQQVDAWSRKGGHLYIEGEVEQRWQGLNLDVSWGAVVNLAKSNGYTPPTRKRYTIDPNHKHETSDMQTERDENKNVLEKWLSETEKGKGKQLLILGSAAGTGKTTTAIVTADAFLYIAKTTDEADKVFDELYQQEQDVMRHRPRMFNRYHKDIDGNDDWETLPLGLGEHDRSCTEADLCDIILKLGHDANEVCSRCLNYANCTEHGYLSQAKKERNTSKVIYAWGESLACDEMLEGLVKRICYKGDILMVDEVNPLELTQKRTLDRETLFDLTERFRHFHNDTADIYQTLKTLLDLISTAETPETFISEVQQWIDGIADLKALDEKIERYPVSVTIHDTPENASHRLPFEATLIYNDQEATVPVVDRETADDTPAYYVDPEKPIETDTHQIRFMPFSFLLKVGFATLDDPPRKHHNLASDLKTFIDENKNIETAPFEFDPKQQTFEYHLKPTLNHRRTLFSTASDPDNLISQAYHETDINITRHTGTPPAWKTDLVFQIASGAYLPRHSLVQYGADKALELKPRAQELIDGFILPTIHAGLKVLVVAPKAFQDVESVRHWAVTDIDEFTQGHTALLINHHHAEGRNDFQDFDIVFVFHYEPNHNKTPLQSKQIYRNPDTPLDFTRENRTITLGGVSFEKSVYIDERVQAVHNRECRARIMQSDMRLRPNIHENKIIVNLTAEPVDIPVTPTPFTPQDAKHFTGDWAAFRETLHAQVTAIEKGDVKGVMETKGVSERTARRQTEQTRDQQKVRRDAEIIRLHRDDVSQREIERQLKQRGYTKVSRKAISKVIARCKTDNPLLYNTNSAVSEMHHPTPPVVTDIQSETRHTAEPTLPTETTQDIDTRAPIALTEYSKLTLEEVRAELQRCEATHNHNGAAYLRDIIKQLDRNQTAPQTETPQTDTEPAIPDGELRALGFQQQTAHFRNDAGETVEVIILHRPAPKHVPLAFQKGNIRLDIEKMYRDGHSHSEIADDLELPEEYVRTLLDSQQF